MLPLQLTWDNDYILVANPNYSTNLPGFWRYDAHTGERTDILSYEDPGDALPFVGWPQELRSGELVFFYFETKQFSPEVGIPLKLFRSHADAAGMFAVRTEVFEPSEVLWIQEEPRAVLLGRVDGGEKKLFYLSDLEEPLQILISNGQGIRHLAWGP